MNILALACYPAWPPEHGGQIRIYHLLETLASLGDRIRLIHPHTSPDPVKKTITPGGIVQIGIQLPEGWITNGKSGRDGLMINDIDLVIARGVDNWPSMKEVVKRELESADIVFCVQPYLYPLIRGCSKLVVLDVQDVEWDVKRVIASGEDLPSIDLEFLRNLEGEAVRDADGCLVMSREDAARLEFLYGAAPSRLHLVGNGAVPVRDWRPSPQERKKAKDELNLPERPVALYFASAHPPNVEIARFIAQHLATGLPGVSFVFAGPVCWILKNLEYSDNIVLLFEQYGEERERVYRAADVGLNPVRRTLPGSDVKVLDYMGHAVPVAATTRGVRGLDLVEGVHYYPLEEGWARAIWKVTSDSELSDHLAWNGLQRARELSWENMAFRLQDVFASVFRSHRSRRSTLDLASSNALLALAEYRHNTPTVGSTPCELVFDLTNACPLKCIHCFRTRHKVTPSFLPFELFEKVPSRFYENARQIDLSGMGEPLFHPRWDQILEYVAAFDTPLVTFNTSLTLTGENRLRRMVELGTAPMISIDAARKKTFELLRPPSSHEQVFGDLFRLRELSREIGNPRFFIRIQWTLNRRNLPELAEFMEIAGEAEIRHVRVHPLAPHHPDLESLCCDPSAPDTISHLLNALDVASSRGVILHLHEHLIQGDALKHAVHMNRRVILGKPNVFWHHHMPNLEGCSFPWTQLNIDSSGRVLACCFSDFEMGNILTGDLGEIWSNYHFGRLRSEVNGISPSPYCVRSPSAGVCCPRIQAMEYRKEENR